MIPGPSLNEEKDPVKRMQKLIERRQHVEDEIAGHTVTVERSK